MLSETAGGQAAVDELMPLVYEQLRGLAASLIGPGVARSVDPTGIVHEAYLKLVDQERVDYRCKTHFFAVAAVAVRRLMVDQARRNGAAKRGGDRVRTTLRSSVIGEKDAAVDLLDLEDALAELEAEEPRAARVVELRFFAGASNADAATHLGVSTATAERDWRYARAWLYRRLGGEQRAD